MRQHRNIHKSYDEPVQRLFNALGFDTYIRPHRHSLDPKVESLFALRGEFALITFTEQGYPQEVVRFGANSPASAPGVEIGSGTWHTVLVLTETAVLLEIKAGPFDPVASKEFAAWSPEEGSEHAARYIARLRELVAEWPAKHMDGVPPPTSRL
jgi:cupin fold WbuC family metalloprotein